MIIFETGALVVNIENYSLKIPDTQFEDPVDYYEKPDVPSQVDAIVYNLLDEMFSNPASTAYRRNSRFVGEVSVGEAQIMGARYGIPNGEFNSRVAGIKLNIRKQGEDFRFVVPNETAPVFLTQMACVDAEDLVGLPLLLYMIPSGKSFGRIRSSQKVRDFDFEGHRVEESKPYGVSPILPFWCSLVQRFHKNV